MISFETRRRTLTGDDTALAGVIDNDTGRVDTEKRLIEAVIANATLTIGQLTKRAGDFSRDIEMEAAGLFTPWEEGE